MSSHLMSFFSVFWHNLAFERQCKAFVLYNYHLCFSYFPEFSGRNRHKLNFETFQGVFFFPSSSSFFLKDKGGKPKRNSLKPPNSRILYIQSPEPTASMRFLPLCHVQMCSILGFSGHCPGDCKFPRESWAVDEEWLREVTRQMDLLRAAQIAEPKDPGWCRKCSWEFWDTQEDGSLCKGWGLADCQSSAMLAPSQVQNFFSTFHQTCTPHRFC